MTEPTELMPCPFCGGAARHLPWKYGYWIERVICDSCRFHLLETGSHTAVERWNRRTPQPTQAQAGAVPLTCEWTHNADDSFWDTECGQSWRFDYGGPKENHMNFCHCCGKPLRIKGGQHGTE